MNQRHPLGWTPLHVAAINGSERLVPFRDVLTMVNIEEETSGL